MSIFDDIKNWFNGPKIDEEIKAFENKDKQPTEKQLQKQSGEGFSDISNAFGAYSIGSYNGFYKKYIDAHNNNRLKNIKKYREMARKPEVSDVIEDAVDESLTEDDNGNIATLKIKDESINKKESLVKNLNQEFEDLFYNKITFKRLHDMLLDFYTDGELWVENIINESKKKDGIINIRQLPPETMDTIYDQYGRVQYYLQYKKIGMKKPVDAEEAKKDKNITVFNPTQITKIKFKKGGGYLEKCKIPYNQLKLLETSMIIYRIVRAPERFVFKIDTGAMPRDKAMAFVEKIKKKMNKKQSFDPDTGNLDNNTAILSLNDNFFIPQGEGRGSDISTIGGSNIGFAELDDIYYFQKKLYVSLKYPLSRIENKNEKRSSENLFGGNDTGEIVRDEIKWSKFLERNMSNIADSFLRLFLLHLDFKGLKNNINRDSMYINFNNPNNYKDQMQQNLLQTRMDNYMNLSNEEEFSKKWLMMRYLNLTEDEIKNNANMKEEDKKLGLKSEDDMGF